MLARQALIALIAAFASAPGAMADAGICPTKLERLVETRKEGNRTIHVCVCNDGYVRSAESKKCVRAKKLKTTVSGDITLETWDGRQLDAKAIAKATTDPKAASAVFARGNTVTTGADSQFSMKLPDGESVSINSNSILGFDTVDYSSEGQISRMIWSLQDGALHWEGEARKLVDKSVANLKYRYGVRPMRTDVVCGVRGTKFDMVVKANAGGGICWDVACACHRPCEPSTAGHVDLYEGALDIFGKDGALLMTMKPGERVVFDSEGTPIGPTQIPQ